MLTLRIVALLFALDPTVARPRPDLTPGATMNVTAAQVCVHGYTAKVRNVPDSLKQAVFERYGMGSAPHSCCEVDHLISLELGGSNDITNLWPQPYLPKPGAREKDVAESYLHRQVCRGKMTLAEAQHAIVTDWYAVYLKAKASE